MALVLELMASTGQSVSSLRDAIPEFAVIRKKLKVRPEQAPGLLRRLRRHYAGQRLSFLDGVFVDLDDAWVHARRSNTEPVIRITAEAASPERANQLAEDALAFLDRPEEGSDGQATPGHAT
jgi:phosphomannomutase